MSLGGVRDPLRPVPRHVLAARGGGGRLRRGTWCRRRRRRRERRPVATRAVAFRELSGGAAARARRQRLRAGRLRPRLLQPRRRSSTTSPRPGEAILSTLPLKLTAQFSGCPDQGYSSCGPEDYRDAEGTSFAAPQVTRRGRDAALGRSHPRARPGDRDPRADGDRRERRQRLPSLPARARRVHGLGAAERRRPRLRRSRARCRRADALEPNDDAGSAALAAVGAARARSHATLDFWDDQNDVYRIRLRRGQKLFAVLSGRRARTRCSRSGGPRRSTSTTCGSQDMRVRLSARPGSCREALVPRAADRVLLPAGEDPERGGGAGPTRSSSRRRS